MQRRACPQRQRLCAICSIGGRPGRGSGPRSPFGRVWRACSTSQIPGAGPRQKSPRFGIFMGDTVKTTRFVLLLLGLAAGVAYAADDVQIYVLSNHADLISGGDVLVGIAIPAGADASSMRVTLGDHDVTAAFAVRADGRYFGRIEGLALGENVVTARLPDGRGARITITNHPSSGPVFSGLQVQPWSCNSGASDAGCSRAPSYQYLYVPAGIDPQTTPGVIGGPPGPDADFQTYDPGNPPPAAAIAQTTTDQGRTGPFIVRLENGSVDRGQYQIAVLDYPARPVDIG